MFGVEIITGSVDSEEVPPLIVVINSESAVRHRTNAILIFEPVIIAGISEAPHRSPHGERIIVCQFQIIRFYEDGRSSIQIHMVLVDLRGIRDDLAEMFQRVTIFGQIEYVNPPAGTGKRQLLPLLALRLHEPLNHTLRNGIELADPFLSGVIYR